MRVELRYGTWRTFFLLDEDEEDTSARAAITSESALKLLLMDKASFSCCPSAFEARNHQKTRQEQDKSKTRARQEQDKSKQA